MFHTGPRFHLHVFFTCFIQAPSFHLHVFYMFHTGPLFSFTCFLHVSYKPPFFHLHGIYMFHKGSLFSFTWFLQGFKHSVSRLFVAFGRIIYKLFTWLSKVLGRYCKSVWKILQVFTCSSNNHCQTRQCKSVFTEHLHAVLKAVNFL